MKSFKIEILKQKKIILVLCVLLPFMLNLLLLFDLSFRYEGYLLKHRLEYGLSYWQLIFKEQTILYFSEFCHIVAATLVYELFYVELKYNGWMLVSSSEYRKNSVIKGKFVVIMFNLFIFFLTDYILLFLIGKIIGVEGKFEYVMFIKSFLIQIIASEMMVAFYILLVCLFKKITILIPVSFGFMILNISLYYTDSVKLITPYPFTYISHGFRATNSEMVLIILVSTMLTLVFTAISKKILSHNCDIRL